MSKAIEKLENDVAILEKMAENMSTYLRSKGVFGLVSYTTATMPRLTLGGYLMRQHRLRRLASLLSPADQERVKTAVFSFQDSLKEKIVLSENKGHEELKSRIRQWSEELRDFKESGSQATYTATTAEIRTMIDAIIEHMSVSPYQLDSEITKRIANLDVALQSKWKDGPFIWEEAWQDAYPKERFWWLYGSPA